MEPRRSKCSLGGLNGAWDIQMEPGRCKWSLGGPNEAWGVQMEIGRFQIEPWALLLMRILDSNDYSGAPARYF